MSISLLSEMTAAAALIILVALPLSAVGAAAPSQAPAMGLANCDTKCGDIIVPYPFGMGSPHCYHSAPGFNLTCADNTTTHPRLLIGNADGTLQVESFDLSGSSVRVMRTPGEIRVDADGRSGSVFGGGLEPYITLSPGSFGGGNELVLLGCNVRATLKNGNATVSACSSLCDDSVRPLQHVFSRLDTSMLCTGVGCCQAPIVFVNSVDDDEPAYHVQLEWFGWNRSADEEQMPAHVFIADEGWFEHKHNLNTMALQPEDIEGGIPVWLSWEVAADDPSSQAQSINSSHSVCTTEGTRGGYRCSCEPGYDGNPYIKNGCQDINECELYRCLGDAVCTNTDGAFDCGCPPGTHGNHTLPGGCVPSVGAVTDRCNSSCGDVDVPYPFGMGPSHCYRPGFNLTCDYQSSGIGKPPRLLLDDKGFFQVVDISLKNTTLRVVSPLAIEADSLNSFSFTFKDYITDRGQALYSLSTGNELVLTGCNAQTRLVGRGEDPAIVSGCTTLCPDDDDADGTTNNDNNCYGTGCCQARISMSTNGMPDQLRLKFADLNSVNYSMMLPPYALIAEEGWFNKRLIRDQRLQALQRQSIFVPKIPMVLEWELSSKSAARIPKADGTSHPVCPAEVAADICKSKHSQCKPGNRGYSCQCHEPYHGNPYVHNGCKGSLMSYKGIRVAVIGIAFGAGLVLLVLTSFFTSKKLRHHRVEMLKQKYFKQNRGQLLQQLVSQRADIAERMIITLEELKKATHDFDKHLEVGGGGHGTVFKGILSNQHIVAIKKPKKGIKKEIDEFINEVAILSQINHRNVVKLYGCCLETEVPMLVYEFISNGTLYEHLHVEGPRSLSWDDRLRIAIETAKSLAYLHSTASVPIIHRDVKSANILLDDTLTAKVADFGASRYIPMDKSEITTMAQGTRGYWDPMYFYTGRLTEKSDVYSFGVVLVELLTRKKPFSYLSSEGEGLVVHFVTLFTESNLIQILDPQVMEEGGREVEEIAAIAVACTKLRGEDRPTMRQVELTLEGYRGSKERILDSALPKKVEKNDFAINCSSTNVRRGGEESTRCYSMEEEFMLSASYPR